MKQTLFYISILITLSFLVGCVEFSGEIAVDRKLSEQIKEENGGEADKITVREYERDIFSKIDPEYEPLEIEPSGKHYKETKEGYTLIFDDYTFEKKSATYGKLADITFIIKNEQGSATIFPSLTLLVTDKVDSKFTISKDIDISEWLSDQDSIKRKVVIDLGIGEIAHQKEMKLILIKGWGEVINSVSFDVNLTEDASLG